MLKKDESCDCIYEISDFKYKIKKPCKQHTGSLKKTIQRLFKEIIKNTQCTHTEISLSGTSASSLFYKNKCIKCGFKRKSQSEHLKNLFNS